MTLPQADREFLDGLDIDYEVVGESGMICVVLKGWELPAGFDQEIADTLIRLAPGYPDIPPDMWWLDPPARLAGGVDPRNTGVYEGYLGRKWQRWSRHLNAGQWKSGIDCLETYVALIRQELQRSVPAGVR